MGELFGLGILLLVALVVAVALLSFVVVHDAIRPPRHTAGYAVARGLAVDPGELGLEFQEWSLDLPDGSQLPVWEVAGTSEAGREPEAESRQPALTAVFIHGWGGSRIDMLGRLEPWRGLCTRLVLYDLRGHGEASCSRSPLGHGEEKDLRELLDRLGEGPFVLVGHDLGAVIALAAVSRTVQDQVSGVVAYRPYCSIRGPLGCRLRARGCPDRPLVDLALGWLWLRGIRPVRLRRRDLMRVSTPLLVVDPAVGSNGADCNLIVDAVPDATLIEAGPGSSRHDDAVRELIGRRHGPDGLP